MSFASANRTAIKRIKEVTFGTTPATPALIETRFTGESMDSTISTEKSAEIRDDRMLSDLSIVDSSPGGGLNIEFSYGSYDDLIEALMLSAWSTPLAIDGVAGDISTVVAATDNLTSTTGGKFTNVIVGQWIKLAGFTSAVNGFFQVTGKTDNQTLTVSPQPGAAETPAGTAAQVRGTYIKNGTTEQSFSFIKLLQDATVATTRQIFRGMRVGSMNLEMNTAALMTGSLAMMAKSAEWTEAAFAGETLVAAPTTSVLNCVSNVQNVLVDGAALGTTGSLSTLSLEVNNNHREQKGIGVLGNVGLAAGRLAVNISASQYFESKALADKFEAAIAFSFAFRLQDTAGNAYIFTMPRCKYETFVVNATGLDTDVMADTTFTATRDPVTNCMLQIDRFPVA